MQRECCSKPCPADVSAGTSYDVTTFFLVRHASHDLLGKTLAGRTPGVHLNARGAAEAGLLAERLARDRLVGLYSSPRERARATAEPIAARLTLPLSVDSDIDEIDFGDWTARSFAELSADSTWPTWVHRRSIARAPGGESFEAVQRRVTAALERLRIANPEGTVALFTHGDVIKAALAHVLGLSLDNVERFEIAPASISILYAEAAWAQVRLVNDVGHLTTR